MADMETHVGTVDYDNVQEEFQGILDEVAEQGPELEQFRLEYEKLFRALRNSHESEGRLVSKTTDLMAQISALQENIFRSKKEEEEMAAKKKRLQDDISDTWKKVQESQENADGHRTNVAEHKRRCGELEEQLKQGSGWTPEQTAQMAELKKERDDLSREVDAKVETLQELRTRVGSLADEVQEAEEKRDKVEAEIADCKAHIAEKQAETNREMRRKRRLDEELRQLKAQVESLSGQLRDRQGEAARGRQQLERLKGQLETKKQQSEKVHREYNSLFQRMTKTAELLEERVHANQRLEGENLQRERDLEQRRREVAEVDREVARVTKLKDHTERRIRETEKDRDAVERKRDELKAQIKELEAAIESERKEGEILKKKVENHAREREILNRNLVKADEASRRTYDLIKIHENTRKNLSNEISGYEQHGREQRDLIESLEQERERYTKEVETTMQRYYTALEEVKLQDMQIAELQKRILEGETKLKQQQNLYEAVRADRNLYSKNLVEAQEEIGEMKRKFRIMNHQIEQLKEEVTNKDHALVQEHFDHHKVEKDKEMLQKELAKIRKQIQSSEQIISNQEGEVQKLTQIIAEAEEEKSRQQKELESVVNERDILGSQLIRRNEELAKLYEKIKIQKSMLSKGEAQYDGKMAEVEALKRRIAELKEELESSKSQVANVDELRNEVFRLERELLAEKNKIKALSEELERPINVHRWRKLAGSDPKRFELVRKIQSLQKQMIAKTEEVAEKDVLIQEKEKLYVELKNILARQPGPEVAEQLAVYQQNLKEKQRQLKAMTKELEMYKAQADEHKYDIQRLGEQMEKLKQQYFAKMRKERRQQERAPFYGGRGDSGEGGDYDQQAAFNAYAGYAAAGESFGGASAASIGGDALPARTIPRATPPTKGIAEEPAAASFEEDGTEGGAADPAAAKGSGPD